MAQCQFGESMCWHPGTGPQLLRAKLQRPAPPLPASIAAVTHRVRCDSEAGGQHQAVRCPNLRVVQVRLARLFRLEF